MWNDFGSSGSKDATGRVQARGRAPVAAALLSAATLLCGAFPTVAAAQVGRTNADFTYQGRVNVQGVPFTGTLTVRAELFADAVGGVPLAAPVQQSVTVTDGLFTMPLDFGSVEAALAPRFVGISLRAPGDTEFTTLSPRQPLSGVPVAGTADRALSVDLINTSASPTYTLIASQNANPLFTSQPTHWQAFTSTENGRMLLLTLWRRGGIPVNAVRVRIYQGVGTAGPLLHQQFSSLPSVGEAVISLGNGVQVVAGGQYTWEVQFNTDLALAHSADDPTPTLPSSLAGADYAFRAYVGNIGDATIRAQRVGIGVASPEAD